VTNKPTTIINGCLGMCIIAAFSVYKAFTPATGSASTQDIPEFILLGVAVYILGVMLVWSRNPWGRWLLFVWFIAPLFLSAYTDAAMMEQDFNQLLGERLFLSWVSLLYLFSLASLFLPPSSKWLKGDDTEDEEQS
jgi:hypothetical protein